MANVRQPTDNSSRQNFYCQIDIDDVELIPNNILSLTIREWVFDILPRLELIVMDDGVLTEGYPVKEGSLINITIGNSNEDEDMISMQFMVQDVAVDVLGDNKMTNVSITGLMKTTDMFTIRNRNINSSLSVDAFQQLAGEVDITFSNPDDISTTDRMTWLQLNIDNYKMFRHVLERSSKSGDTIFCYGNTASEIVVKSLRNATQTSDALRARYDLDKFALPKSRLKNGDEQVIWFNSYDIVNINGLLHKMGGSGFALDYYDQSRNQRKTSDVDFQLGNNTTKINPGQITNHQQFGIINDNVYNDYFEAVVRNQQLRAGFFGQSMVMAINPIANVQLMDLIDVIVPSLVDENMNDVYSGEYLVGGIIHNVSKGMLYRKRISLHRSGLNQSANA